MASASTTVAKTKRIRGRAYLIRLDTYSKNEIEYLRNWASDKCSYWIIAHTILNGVPAIDMYVRFPGIVARSNVAARINRAIPELCTGSFKNKLAQYTNDSQFTSIESFDMAKAAASKAPSPKQLRIASLVDSEGTSGKIVWISYQMIEEPYRALRQYLSTRDGDVLVTQEDCDGVYQLINDEIINRRRNMKAIALFPKAGTQFDHDYLLFLDDLRSGYSLNPIIRGSFKPLNVIVVTTLPIARLPKCEEGDRIPLKIESIAL